MSLTLATLLPGLLLIALGLPLVLGSTGYAAVLKAFPRSTLATYVLFGAGAAWFLHGIWHLSPADFGEYRKILFCAFGAVALLSFKCVPDFLAVRGVCVLVLMAAMPLLDAAYMEYAKPQRLLMVSLVYGLIALAVWFGAQPWRMRDFIGWLFARPGRSRVVGGAVAAYGAVLSLVAFSY